MDTVDQELNQLQTIRLIEQFENLVLNHVPIDRSLVLTSRPGNHENVEKFLSYYDHYQEPRYDTASFLAMFEACEIEKKAINMERINNARRNNIPEQQLDLFKDRSMEKDKIIENDGKFLGLRPMEGGHKIPIMWKKEVTMDNFKKLVKFYGDSKENKKLALPATLKSLVDEAEKKHFSKKQLAELLTYFTKEYVPELNAIASEKYQQKKWREVYVAIVRRMDIREEKNKIVSSMRKVTRQVGDNIASVVSLLQNLCYQGAEITQPYSTEASRTSACEEFIRRNIRFFINTKCFRRYNKFLEKPAGMYEITLSMCISEIQEIESKGPEYRITEPKRLPSNTSLIDIMPHADPKPQLQVNNITTGNAQDRKSRKDKQYDKKKPRTENRSQSGYRSSRSRASSMQSTSRSRSRSASVNQINEAKTSYPGKDKPKTDAKTQESNNKTNKEKYQEKRYKNNNDGRFKSRSGSRDPTKRLRSRSPREDGACVRCGYQGHKGVDCFRFSQPSNTHCAICLKKGFKLLHDTFYCNRSSRSSYRSPTPETRKQRINYLKEVNESKN